MAVHQGYWSGYYSRSKKPKSLDTILKKLFKAKEKSSNKFSKHEKAEEVDVAAFLAREQLRLSQMK